ncbi:rna-directed dna polymerase from mobile element jockey-like [Willisornis vidua]|uniref:Rna-directed dna polymerase from mobile element jockey-like n=1 Tax=Willisornis vidua TaxID=1566151 RepID=A0ABQ9DR63_9PASS|nr:rna-directed dna polymerase from mobile element jockey-like [Willisornis vidua]
MECQSPDAMSIHVDDKKVIGGISTEGKSSLTNMIAFYNETTTWMNEWRTVDIAYFNFSMALSTVSHNILIGKLRKHGLDEWTVNWLKNCLNGRSQRVVISSTRAGDLDSVTLVGPFQLVTFCEWLILKVISKQVDDKKVFRNSQHGFTKEESSFTNLVAIYNWATV